MAICEICGTTFIKSEAEDIFESEFPLPYANIRKCLCGSCAVQVIQGEVDGIYYEVCEECGKEFDLIEESSEFENNVDGTTLRDYWNYKIMCCDCALKKV